ncbi:MAG TPA: dihydrofolate reductase family protein, partial [Gemmatimonadales bacterium]|nr:dihydrofolate reductase family protein [Gemmatimonadales bacterium]
DARLTVRGTTVPRVPPWRVVFDRSGRLTDDHGIFRGHDDVPVIVVHGAGHSPQVTPRQGVTLVEADELRQALVALRGLGVDALLIEGGGRLAGRLLREDLVDRIYQLQAPVWLGDGIPAWAELGGHDLADAIRWHTVERKALDDDTLLGMER